MKNMIVQGMSIGILAFALAACGKVGDAPEAKTDSAVTVAPATGGMTLPIDTSRSSITWKGAKVTGAHDGGFRQFDGTITVDNDQVTGVKVTIDAGSIWADDEKLTGHLKSDDFFSVANYPTATFEAGQFTKVDTVQGATHMVTGNLTMRGKTNSVTFPATIMMNADMVSAKADFIIDRKQWDIIYPGQPDNLISDEVRIIFDVVAAKPAA